MVALIAVVIIAAVAFIGTSSSEQFNSVGYLRRRPGRLLRATGKHERLYAGRSLSGIHAEE